MKLHFAFLQAWRSVTHDVFRYAVYSLGISFAVVLIFVEWGFQNALLDSNVALIRKMNADLVLINPQGASLFAGESFSRRRLYQIANLPGVQSVHPLYVYYSRWLLRNPSTESDADIHDSPIRVIGVDPNAYLLKLPELDPTPGAPLSLVNELKHGDHALFDRLSKPNPDRPGESVFGPLRPGVSTDLGRRHIDIVGEFDIGTDFAADGTMIVSDRTFARLASQFSVGDPLAMVQFGLIRLDPGADVTAVANRIRDALPEGDVEVLTPSELVKREREFWQINTPIGTVFGFGMAMGFVVGLVICYQILASEVGDHLAEYATLKAIGYSATYLSAVVLNQGLLMGASGFVPGLIISAAVYSIVAHMTGLPMDLTPGQIVVTFLITLLMCTGSGLLALRKVKEADPAEVF
jgi:putative ABC transport system permease protein